jgi:hypothetical protein
MKSNMHIGRVGGLAVALGIGAWLCSDPSVAAADPSGASGLDLTTLDSLLIPFTSDAASDTSAMNLAVSYDGMTVIQMGDATASSSPGGGLAIADGDGAVAEAGTYTNPDGYVTTGTGDYALATGTDSTAIATGADYSTATASDGGTAASGLAISPGGSVSLSPAYFDSAHATGTGSVADAEGGSFDTATASDGGTADSGFLTSTIPGIGDFSGGAGDSATADGAGSTADAGLGNNDIAEVFGSGSSAIDGGDEATLTAGNSDFVEVLGNALSYSTDASNIFQIITPFGDAASTAASAVPVDDFGLSSLLADLGTLGF